MRNRDRYYILWFGPFKRKSIEQVALLPDGYRYLRQLLDDLTRGVLKLHRPRMEMQIKEVIKRGENLPVKAKCSCGESTATRFSTLVDDRGYYSFGQIFCEECKNNIPLDIQYDPLLIRLTALLLLPQDNRTQRDALRVFKYCWFLNEKERITKRTAQKLFFPELFGKVEDGNCEPPIQRKMDERKDGVAAETTKGRKPESESTSFVQAELFG